eukprot:CAMPEP_0203936782 /NCGR_PEP_ID=MMETSP0359-20131031/74204_1 /ASSEMBLY_ACC=CAM_ASM_000338 /TAXON_ID=268821 /ORGANISM="Scrippsiella Hangoei, Strain SHTV-5" /LENGTH=47 /DNA_ID= /DNA_START= /DNA_END= /DNA_ORIENTATION=
MGLLRNVFLLHLLFDVNLIAIVNAFESVDTAELLNLGGGDVVSVWQG